MAKYVYNVIIITKDCMEWKNTQIDGYPSEEGWYLTVLPYDFHEVGHCYHVRYWNPKNLSTQWTYNGVAFVTHWVRLCE